MRGAKIKKRQVQTESVYKSRSLTRLINFVMRHGKKPVAESIVYDALNMVNEDKKEALTVFDQALRNVMPRQEVRSRRVGGATYQIPFPVRHERAEALAVRWLVTAARNRKGKPMAERLFLEIKDASVNTGPAVKKKEDVHRMAEANRAFSHFRF